MDIDNRNNRTNKKTKPKKRLSRITNEITGVNTEHEQIIDTWFNNGYNGLKAVKEIRPNVTNGSAAVIFNTIIKHPTNREYIQSKRANLKAEANITTEQILKELLSFAYADVTDFIGLELDEIKKLPADIRRQLKDISIKEKKYKDRQGKEVIEKNITFKLIDKSKVFDMINKYIGLYEVDNKQKANNTNVLQQFDKATLNILLNAVSNPGLKE